MTANNESTIIQLEKVKLMATLGIHTYSNTKMDTQDCPPLPKPQQIWAHSTCSVEQLLQALTDTNITAIESDIVCGSVVNKSGSSNVTQPIMAHPPSKQSDLSFKSFIEMSTSTANENTKNSTSLPSQSLRKHLKLDFKEIEAVRQGLDILGETIFPIGANNCFDGKHDKIIYLNADIIHGPGLRHASLSVRSEEFITACLQFLQLDMRRKKQCAFSLGWKSDCRSFTGYTKGDIQKMKDIIQKNKLLSSSRGVVLAANARVLARNPSPFDSILKEIPELNLLIWTGTGEPPISPGKIELIKKHFEDRGCIHQVGFDCQIAESFLWGLLCDSAVEIVGLFWNAQNFVKKNIRNEIQY